MSAGFDRDACRDDRLGQPFVATVKKTPAIPKKFFREFVRSKLLIAKQNREIERLKSEASRLATALIGQVTEITTELFGDRVEIKYDCDPEFPQDKHVVLIATPSLSPAEIVDAEDRWVKAVAKIAPEWNELRLLIIPK